MDGLFLLYAGDLTSGLRRRRDSMVISYVVRLRPDALSDGRFVGEIEAVTSRQRKSICTIDQMAAFILATVASQTRASAAAKWAATVDDPAATGVECLAPRERGGEGGG